MPGSLLIRAVAFGLVAAVATGQNAVPDLGLLDAVLEPIPEIAPTSTVTGR